MNLVRFRNPYYGVNRNLVDDLFSNMLRNDHHEDYLNRCGSNPATNIAETATDFQIEMLLPGFRKDEVKMEYHKKQLTVKAEKPENNEQGNETKYQHREFGFYSFTKKFSIPETVDAEKISAQFEDGVLRITLPKKEEALEKDPVEIKIG